MRPERIIIARPGKMGATDTRTTRRCLRRVLRCARRGRTCASSWSTPSTQALEAQAEWLGPTPHVIEHTDMATLYTTAAALLFSSHYEGFDLSVLQGNRSWKSRCTCAPEDDVFREPVARKKLIRSGCVHAHRAARVTAIALRE